MDFLAGMVMGLTCALVGGLIVFVVMLYRDGNGGGGGFYDDYPSFNPSRHGPEWKWSIEYDKAPEKPIDVDAVS